MSRFCHRAGSLAARRGKRAGGLAHLDQVAVRIADVAAELRPAVLRRSQELRAARTPLLIDRLNLRDADVEEAADPVGIGRRLEDHGGLVLRRSATQVDDDPAIGQRDDRGLALEDSFAAEDVHVEAARALDIVGDNEMSEGDYLPGRGELGHRYLLGRIERPRRTVPETPRRGSPSRPAARG